MGLDSTYAVITDVAAIGSSVSCDLLLLLWFCLRPIKDTVRWSVFAQSLGKNWTPLSHQHIVLHRVDLLCLCDLSTFTTVYLRDRASIQRKKFAQDN